MVNRRTLLRKTYWKEMIYLQWFWNPEEGLKHNAEIGRGHIADIHGTEPQRLGSQKHLQDAVRKTTVEVWFPLVQLCTHRIGIVRARITKYEYMGRSISEIHASIHAPALAASHFLDFDFVAHLSLEDLDNLFPSLPISYYKKFPGL